MLNFILKLIKKILKTPVRVLLPVLSFFITLYILYNIKHINKQNFNISLYYHY